MSFGPVAKISKRFNYKIGLLHAYSIALTLIAFSMLASHFVVTNKIRDDIVNAAVINSSGMQRMLSQRIGLLAREIVASRNTDTLDELVEKFESAWEKFNSNHVILVDLAEQSSEDSTIRILYGGLEGVDARSKLYLELTREFLSRVNNFGNTDPKAVALMLDIVAIARNGFLQELDAVVGFYESESTIAKDEFVDLERLILLIGLSLLLFEAIFIFRPIANASKHQLNSLETSNKELAEFSFRISHDLRSPIASCRGMVEIAKESIEEKDEELTSDMVNRIEVAMEKIDILIEDIICVTRTKVVTIDPVPVDIRTLVTDTLQTLSAVKGFDEITFDIAIEPNKMVVIQKLYLQQIVENILSNAVKYSTGTDSSNIPRVSIALAQQKANYELTIDDNGIGIPENCRDKLFGMFMRFHPKIANGSGLGLYLTKQNALAMGGNLRYEPLTSGSRFIVDFKSV